MKFELEPHNRNVTDQDLVDDVIRVAKLLDKSTLTIKQYDSNGKYHNSTLSRRFGSWAKTLQKAGLESSRNFNISNEELFENLIETWTILGRQPKYADIKQSKYSVNVYEIRFGGWRKALEAFVIWVNDGEAPDVQAPLKAKTKKRTPRNINWRLRAMVLMQDGAICKLCGASPQDGAKLHVDHIVPWSKGGETVFENLQILCEKCNIGKSNIELQKAVNK